METRGANEFPKGTTTRTVTATLFAKSTIVVIVSGTVTLGQRTASITSTITKVSLSTKFYRTTVFKTSPSTGTIVSSTTTTSTTTKTVYVPIPTPDVSCPNSGGLEVALYDNVYQRTTESGDYGFYDNFEPTFFKTAPTYDTSRSNVTGIAWDTPDNSEALHPYGMTARVTSGSSSYVLNHRGYFYAPKTMSYTFRVSQADDWCGVWAGEKAYTNWNKDNLDAASIYGPGGSISTGEFKLTLTGGSFTPLRILLANAGGAVKFAFEIIGEDGESYVQSRIASPFLVAYSCQYPDIAPPYLSSFGAEPTTAGDAPDRSCNNYGLDVAIYHNPFVGTSGSYPEFVPQYFKGQLPYNITKTTYPGFVWPDDGVNEAGSHPYGLDPPTPDLAYTLNHRGYFYAPGSATYFFQAYRADNYGGLWTESKAISSWTRENEDGESTCCSGDQWTSGAIVAIYIDQPTFIPLRFMLANWAGAVHANFDIYDDNGAYYARTGLRSRYLVRFACDDSVALFPDPWGSET
ncbi:hypothetical protein H072_930 [Dactylellina haptotyla CBS 200.50]|uniref:PA14 domain-containing protein n=1 Tax=Dactylellina haptotyla (strain CBS 200.50) TaxID=1284197 RepID=S8CBM4_DACHA|nr:hypothetical protein H072_930 [Dactylellina haptotyla CBS 200.50]